MFKEYFIVNLPTTTLAGGSGTTFTEIDYRMPQFDFELRRTIHTATSDLIYKKLYDGVTTKYLYSGAPSLLTISGKSLSGITPYGFLPYNWPIPYTMKALTLLQVYLSDYSTSSNVIDLSYHGIGSYQNAPLDMSGKPVDFNEQRTIVPMVITSQTAVNIPGPITAPAGIGQFGQGVITIKQDADFVCTKITGISDYDGYVSITDTNRNIDWQQNPTRISNLIGNGQFPNVLPAPRFMRNNTNLQIKWTNNNASANNLYLFLHGWKRYAS